MAIQSSYLQTIYEPTRFTRTVDRAVEEAEKLLQQKEFDTVAFTGMSGAAMAYLLAYKLKVQLLCIRKTTDGSHFHQTFPYGAKGLVCEGNLGTKRYMIVDDFITSGNTVNQIINSVSKEAPGAKCVAILMYAQSYSSICSHHTLEKPFEVTHFYIE
jgi:orotate phosphoribosyltransferase-like protein